MIDKVSIWFGNFSNERLFKSYLEKIYDYEGNSSSKFMEEFSIEFYDEDYQDTFYQSKHDFYSELLELSYAESFLKKINQSINCT